MDTILLAIKPEYVKKIFDGTKKYEFRKRLPQSDVKRIIIYSTFPEKKVLGEVEVIGTLSMKRTPLWERTKEEAGISREKYREYFCSSLMAHAYVLGKVTEYPTPMALKDFGVEQAPQSFVYV